MLGDLVAKLTVDEKQETGRNWVAGVRSTGSRCKVLADRATVRMDTKKPKSQDPSIQCVVHLIQGPQPTFSPAL